MGRSHHSDGPPGALDLPRAQNHLNAPVVPELRWVGRMRSPVLVTLLLALFASGCFYVEGAPVPPEGPGLLDKLI